MNITKKELLNDMEKATEFDQSVMFKQIYEEEYGTFGGNPYSLLVGDFEFGRHPQDMSILEKMSGVAAAAHAPFIAAASPKLFDMDSFNELGVPRDMAKAFESTELIKWRSFRDSEDSRYVTLTLPHMLLRLPYGPDTVPVDGFDYREDVDGKDSAKYLWGNSAYAMAQRITNAFAQYKWCAAIRGVEGGGLVEGLPAHTFKTDSGDIALKCPTETAITDRREKELSDLGFIALCHAKGTDFAAFFGGQTANKPKLYNTSDATANARVSGMLPYVLAASRFAHYLKVIMRDKIGSFMTRENVAAFLNTWISQYVLLSDDAPQAVKAKFPLREARVDVMDVPGKPGVYKAVVFLKPHFQLDELTVSIRLVAELPPPAANRPIEFTGRYSEMDVLILDCSSAKINGESQLTDYIEHDRVAFLQPRCGAADHRRSEQHKAHVGQAESSGFHGDKVPGFVLVPTHRLLQPGETDSDG